MPRCAKKLSIVARAPASERRVVGTVSVLIPARAAERAPPPTQAEPGRSAGHNDQFPARLFSGSDSAGCRLRGAANNRCDVHHLFAHLLRGASPPDGPRRGIDARDLVSMAAAGFLQICADADRSRIGSGQMQGRHVPLFSQCRTFYLPPNERWHADASVRSKVRYNWDVAEPLKSCWKPKVTSAR